MIVQQTLQIWSPGLSASDLDEFGMTVAARQLDKTQSVTLVIEPKRLGVDCDNGSKFAIGGKVALVQTNAHS